MGAEGDRGLEQTLVHGVEQAGGQAYAGLQAGGVGVRPTTPILVKTLEFEPENY